MRSVSIRIHHLKYKSYKRNTIILLLKYYVPFFKLRRYTFQVNVQTNQSMQ